MVIPADGVISANFPMTLLNGVSPEARVGVHGADRLAALAAAQQMIMDTTSRRPVTPRVKPDPDKFGDSRC